SLGTGVLSRIPRGAGLRPFRGQPERLVCTQPKVSAPSESELGFGRRRKRGEEQVSPFGEPGLYPWVGAVTGSAAVATPLGKEGTLGAPERTRRHLLIRNGGDPRRPGAASASH